ncbi:MAG: nicotinate phosphoribosyltransferase [Candidatus Bipolaricaulia bacterium]
MSQAYRRPDFHVSSTETIRSGHVTDVYFARSKEILDAKGIDRHVVMEVRARKLPVGEWGVLCGLEEVMALLEGQPVDVWALPEGTVFNGGEPALLVEANYRTFSVYETALLGELCQASGIATKAARCVTAAQGRPVYSFGARRMHPAIAPMIERAAYVGGCAGVACVPGAELIGESAVGTVPHALVLVLGDSTSATLAFDEIIDPDVPRVALVDTFGDEKFESLENVELLDANIFAVRLDTTSSRRGDMRAIAGEVRWEFDIRGYENVQLFVSGGLDEDDIPELLDVVDAFGVGTAISNAAVVDFAMDIVEIEGDPMAKRGKESGAKQLYVCSSCGHRAVTPFSTAPSTCPACASAGAMEPQLVQYLANGELLRDLPDPQAVRQRVLAHLPNGLGANN